MPREVLHFVVSFVEVIAALAALLVAGLLITMAGLWITPRILGLKVEQLEDYDPDDEDVQPQDHFRA